MPEVHAILSASSSKRWLNCTPSARLEQNFPNESSVYAEEGTAAHALGEYKLRKYLHERVQRPTSEYENEEMEANTDIYAEFIISTVERIKETCPHPLVMVEERLDYSYLVPSGFGTGDCVIIADGTLYVIQDVNTEVDIYKRLKKFPMPELEWQHYRTNERINDRGVRIDTELVQEAITCDLMLSDAMSKKAYELTGLENPNSVSQLKSWLEERGIPMDTLGKKDVAQMITELDKNGVDAEALDMLKLRLQMAKSSVKKYQAAERCVCPDGRARGLFQFYGASRTGRYSGRNIQLQNLPQNHISTLDEARTLVRMGCFDMVESIYGNTPDVLSQLIRTMLIPKDGCEFIVADFSAIEARVLAWEAEEQWVLDAFQNGEDLYCATASQMFHVPVVKHGINGDLRQKGKIATLACGYGGSSGALISMGALQMGLHEEELPEIIDSWREANPKIVQYWWDTEKAAMTAYKTGERQEVGKIAFEFYSGTLWMVLPSGRRLAYLKPRQQPNRFGRMSLTYEGVGQNHKWARQETYSGRLVENATQAIARDILAEAMDRISAKGLNIVAHVHDEVIIEAPKDQYTVDEVCKLMSVNPAWCKGLPLAAAGYKGNYYFKD